MEVIAIIITIIIIIIIVIVKIFVTGSIAELFVVICCRLINCVSYWFEQENDCLSMSKTFP
jgi:hypothetical protein